MVVKVADEASTNKFQKSMSEQQAAEIAKASDPTSDTNPLNTDDGNTGPAFSFAKLNASDLEAVGASYLLANQSDQAHYEIILWTSLYPLPKNLPTLDNYYDFSNLAEESYVSLASYMLVPTTGGNVSINSKDASANPLINLPVSAPLITSIFRVVPANHAIAIVLRGRKRLEHPSPSPQTTQDADRSAFFRVSYLVLA